MCAYDTTLLDSLEPPKSRHRGRRGPLREVATVDCFPVISRSGLVLASALCCTFLLASLPSLQHTDLWTHLSYGRWMVEAGRLPAADPFLASASSQPVVNVPWLAQVLGYQLYEWAGLEGLVLSHALLVTLMVGLTVMGIIQRGTTLGVAVAGGVAALILGLPLIGTIRPQLFSAAALPLVLLACTQLTRGRRPLWWLPILFALWTNLHGSFTMGLAVLGVVCVSKTWEILLERGGWRPALADPQLPRFYLALALSVAGCCINPQGIGLLLMGPRLVGSGSVETSWQPMVLSSLSGILYFSSLFLTMVLIRRSTRRIELQEVLLLTVFGTVALISMRMLMAWALVWPWVVAPHGLAVWRSWRDSWADEGEQDDVQDHATTMHTLVAMAFVFTTLLLAPPTHGLITGRCLGEGSLASGDTPLYVADEIERRGIQGRIFVPLDWADYLIWHSKGQVQPLASWHPPSLPPHVSNDQRQLAQGSSQWLKIVDRHRLQYMVLSRDRNAILRRTMRRHPRTKILYQDQKSVLVQILPPRHPRTS